MSSLAGQAEGSPNPARAAPGSLDRQPRTEILPQCPKDKAVEKSVSHDHAVYSLSPFQVLMEGGWTCPLAWYLQKSPQEQTHPKGTIGFGQRPPVLGNMGTSGFSGV